MTDWLGDPRRRWEEPSTAPEADKLMVVPDSSSSELRALVQAVNRLTLAVVEVGLVLKPKERHGFNLNQLQEHMTDREDLGL